MNHADERWPQAPAGAPQAVIATDRHGSEDRGEPGSGEGIDAPVAVFQQEGV